MNKWDNYFINGGTPPTIDLPDVEEPSMVTDVVYKYICTDCGKANNYWHSLCEWCDNQLEVNDDN